MYYLLRGLHEIIVKIIDVKHSPPWDKIGIMKELDHSAIIKIMLLSLCFGALLITFNTEFLTTSHLTDRL